MAKAIALKLAAIVAIAAALIEGEPPASWIIAAIVAAGAIAAMAWGVFRVNSSIWAPTLWRAPGATRNVALTFDDGPDPEFTPRILEILRGRDVRAAFFVVGERAEKHGDLLALAHEQGHLLLNHSHSHGLWINFSLHRKLRQEIRACNQAIRAAIGREPRLYRPPHGFKNPALGDVLAGERMTAIGWQIRGFDAVQSDPAKIAKRIVSRARAGGVILLHDGAGLQGSDDRSATIAALPVIIDGLRARGLNPVRLDELLDVKGYKGVEGNA